MPDRPPADTPSAGQPTRHLTASLQDDQRARWRRGERPDVEGYLRQHPSLQADPEGLLDLIYHEVLLREERGEAPRLEEYLARFPQFADRLRQQFEVHDALGSTDLFPGATLTWTAPPPAKPTRLPAVAGYEVLRELGRGGMGVVYLARQLSLNRPVALKMIRDGALAGPEQRTRFRTEAEAAARLQHPNIVQVYEVGEHDGRPYIALEYLGGGSLRQHLDGKPLPPREAAGLAETLARAVHHAHQAGIVHRDLKPDNVLLQKTDTETRRHGDTETEGSGVSLSPCLLVSLSPKITDFGLAKLLGHDSGLSETGGLLGTPSYMAPEQAAGHRADVGPAADVYALGAVLYELLTGRPPFQGASPLDTLQQVRWQEPVPPARLQPKVPRDLETICLKCLHKEPARRYAGAADLADDLRRFRAGEPIRARPVGPLERGLKWARRQPFAAALIAVVALAVAGGVAGVLWYNRRVRTERDDAQRNFDRALQAVDEMLTQVAEDQLAFEPRMEEKRAVLLEKAIALYEDLLRDRPGDRRLRKETALACERLGDSLHLLRRLDRAEGAYGKAIALLEGLTAEAPAEPDYRRLLAECLGQRGETRRVASRLPQAAKDLDRALTIQARLRDESPDQPAYRRDWAKTRYTQGVVLDKKGELAEAEKALAEAIEVLAGLVEQSPRTADYRFQLARGHFNLGPVLRKAGRRPDAEDHYGKAIALLEELRQQVPENSFYRNELAVSHNNRGNVLFEMDRPAEALAAHGRARELFDKLAADFPNVPAHRQELANTHNSLARVLALEAQRWRAVACALPLACRPGPALAPAAVRISEAGWSAAERAYEQARGLGEQLTGGPNPLPEYWGDLGMAHGNLAWLLTERGHWDRAAPHLEQSVSHLRRALGPNPHDPYYGSALRGQYQSLAETRLRLGDHEAACRAALGLAEAGGAGAADFCNAARFASRCAAAALEDNHLAPEERRRKADAYRAEGLRLLREAVDRGFRDVAMLKDHPDLRSLRCAAGFDDVLKAAGGGTSPH